MISLLAKFWLLVNLCRIKIRNCANEGGGGDLHMYFQMGWKLGEVEACALVGSTFLFEGLRFSIILLQYDYLLSTIQ